MLGDGKARYHHKKCKAITPAPHNVIPTQPQTNCLYVILFNFSCWFRIKNGVIIPQTINKRPTGISKLSILFFRSLTDPAMRPHDALARDSFYGFDLISRFVSCRAQLSASRSLIFPTLINLVNIRPATLPIIVGGKKEPLLCPIKDQTLRQLRFVRVIDGESDFLVRFLRVEQQQ